MSAICNVMICMWVCNFIHLWGGIRCMPYKVICHIRCMPYKVYAI